MLLSIIIPCYNSAGFISNTLDMLISQGLSDCEVIVVNDGSKDDTSKIVHSYVEKNPSIKIIDKENEGVSIARNIGINEAAGKYVYFLDSDDSLEDGTLDFFREILNKNPENKFFAFGYSTNRNGKMLKDYSFKEFDGKIIDSLLLKQSFLSKELCFNICSCICEKQFLLENNIFFTKGLRIGEDIEFLLNILKFAPACVYNARYCFIYQIRDDSVMGGYKFNKFEMKNFHSYEVRRDKVLEKEFQSDEIKEYSNFWLCTQYISHLIMYLKSSSKDPSITENFIVDRKIFSRPMKLDKTKISWIIRITRILPLKFILRIIK